MNRVIATCQKCGKTIIPEEVEIGMSLVCPRCDPKRKKEDRKKQKVSTH